MNSGYGSGVLRLSVQGVDFLIVRILHRHRDAIIAGRALDYHVVAAGRHRDVAAQRASYLGNGRFARPDEQAYLLEVTVVHGDERAIVRGNGDILAGARNAGNGSPLHNIIRFHLHLISIGVLAIQSVSGCRTDEIAHFLICHSLSLFMGKIYLHSLTKHTR